MAHVHVSWLDPHKTRRLVVVGSKKMAVFDDTSSDQKLVLFDKGVEAPPSAVGYAEAMRVRMGDILIPALKMTEPLRKESEAFLAAIRTRQVPLADGRSGADVVRVLEAGSRSLANDGRRTAIGGEA
jgi:predicted dehydrogenase